MTTAQTVQTLKPAYILPPPPQFAIGTIVTLRMRGHSRTEGREYYAPAIVLNQYDDQFGSIEVLIWDGTAGTTYNHSYPVRDLTTFGDGNERQTRELQSNIGQVLFAPDQFEQLTNDVEVLLRRMMAMEKAIGVLASQVQPVPPAATVAPKPTTPPSEAKPR